MNPPNFHFHANNLIPLSTRLKTGSSIARPIHSSQIDWNQMWLYENKRRLSSTWIHFHFLAWDSKWPPAQKFEWNVNGVLETTFCCPITFGLVWKGGYPVESTPYLPFYYIFPPEFEISNSGGNIFCKIHSFQWGPKCWSSARGLPQSRFCSQMSLPRQVICVPPSLLSTLISSQISAWSTLLATL